MSEKVLDLVSKVKDRRKVRTQSAHNEYKTLLKQIADGKEPSADAIEAALHAQGKTPEDLQTDVDLLLKRRGWAATVASAADIDAKRTDVAARQQKLADDYAKVTEQYHQAQAPLQTSWHGLEALESQASTAREALKRTYNGPLRDHLKELEAKMLGLRKETESLKRPPAFRAVADGTGDAARAAYVANLERENEAAQRRAELDAEAATINAEVDKVYSQMLVP